jgi:hypothetical protein
MRWFFAVAALSCACCAGRVREPPYLAQPATALVEVTQPPPPGRVEAVPPSPRGDAVWVDGEWKWRRHKWAWQPGYWAVPPAKTRFSPWAFVRGLDGRLWVAPGSWRDAKGAAIAQPQALAVARIDLADVVDATGTTQSTGLTQAATPPAKSK